MEEVNIGGVIWYHYGKNKSFEENIKKFQEMKEKEFLSSQERKHGKGTENKDRDRREKRK